MNETAADTTYRDLIWEAYIKPIRSALIIDDDYPTIEELLKNGASAAGSDKKYKTDPGKCLEVITKFRNENWLVDIHDGKNIDPGGDTETVTHLHQSDLLILDYHLDGPGGTPDKAISILKRLASNNHFNLVVIYTQHDDCVEVFNNVAFSLLTPCGQISNFEWIQIDQTQLDEWEIANPDFEEELVKSIDDSLYLIARNNLESCLGEVSSKDGGRFRQFVSLFNTKPPDLKMHKPVLFKWVLSKKQKSLETRFSTSLPLSTTWASEFENDTKRNWIRTNRLFVTVVKKSTATDLPKALLDALEEWSPQPGRLLLAKIRAELDDSGVHAEDYALTDKVLQAGLYHELLEADENSTNAKIDQAVKRHCDGLVSPVYENVSMFVHKILTLDRPKVLQDKIIEVIKHHYKMDWDKDEPKRESAILQNCYNCSHPVEGWHLTTGHILTIDADYWVCLSPACDLVPGQKTSGRYGRLSPLLPFHAVKLHSVPKQAALKYMTRNLYMFLNIDGGKTPSPFCFVDHSNPHSNPVWEELFAKNNGILNNNSICVAQTVYRERNDALVAEWKEAKVVAQLRYEYALNLLQRLGNTMTRVGLDFIPYSPTSSQKK